MFFFFKQKTAYEMRISDWSSDVCSSDLPSRTQRIGALRGTPDVWPGGGCADLCPAFCLVRAGHVAGIVGYRAGGAAGGEGGWHAYRVHHSQHAGGRRAYRYGAGGGAVPAPVRGVVVPRVQRQRQQIGRASWWEGVCEYG